MVIYTSYYRLVNPLHNDERVNLISISKNTADWFSGTTIPILHPTWDMITKSKSKQNKYTWDEYKQDYLILLQERGVFSKETLYPWLDKNKINLLLCHESDNNTCHRSIVGELFNIDEWDGFDSPQQQFLNTMVSY